MSTYTLSGYLSALTVREQRTLMVEGREDRKVLSRIALELQEAGRQIRTPTVIDSADLVRGDDGPIGNRLLVEMIHQRCVAEGLSLAAVVDREFREFDLTDQVEDKVAGHLVKDTTLFWTRGHSLENYFFVARIISSFIKTQFAEHVHSDGLEACRAAFTAILGWAAAVSIAVRDARLIDKSTGLAKLSHWKLTGDNAIALDSVAFAMAFLRRGVEEDACDELAKRIHELHGVVRNSDMQAVQYVVHGHLGWELVWCGVAAALRDAGAAKPLVEGAAYGHGDAKRRACAGILSADVLADSNSALPGLWQWMFKPAQP